jgi:hypothetical protein
MNPPQGLVQVHKARPLREQPLEVSLQTDPPPQCRRFPVCPQTLVILPHGIAHPFHRLLFSRVHGQQFFQ